MPRFTRWSLRTALGYLVAGLGLGVVAAAAEPGPVSSALRLVGVHLVVVGWATQLIFGVMTWLFPKRSRDAPYGRPALLWATYACLNAGLALRAVAEPALAAGQAVWGGALVVSAALQWLASLAFVANTWDRVKER